jgi:hypothetical protein
LEEKPMRSRAAAALVFATAVVGFIIAARALAAAGDMQISSCPAFTATPWVNPYPPNNTGTRYQIGMNAKPFSCGQAEVWVKKFVATRITPSKDMPLTSMPLKGPPGYKCHSGADKNNHAYQGACTKISTDPFAPSFNWSPAH